MVKKQSIEKGTMLEARVQRLFMCQGAFAERRLFLRTVKGVSRLVTDIDIVAHDYSINFHHTRIYAECKGGMRVSTLDRVVWVRGIMNVIGAEFGYLVLDHCDSDSVTFAKSYGIDILQANGLKALESALKIGYKFWPGRSNIETYESIEKEIQTVLKQHKANGFQEWLHQSSEIWRDASALTFSYGQLNTLLRILQDVKNLVDKNILSTADIKLLKYAIAALLVRLSQYILYAASDTLSMTKTEREKYIGQRLTTGNIGIEQSRRMLESSLNLAKSKLEEHGVTTPVNWTVDHLLVPPIYSKSFSQVVERVIADGHRARILPLVMEIRLFGFAGDQSGNAGLLNRVKFGWELTGIVRGFVTQSLSIPENLTGGLSSEITSVKTCSNEEKPTAGQTKHLLFDKKID